MTSKIQFNNQEAFQSSVDIDNIGDFCLEAINEDELFYYYLLVKTSMGISEIFWYGPIIPDCEELPEKYTYSYNKIKYNDRKMNTYVLKWLNDRTKGITLANEIDSKEFLFNNFNLNELVKKYI